MWFKFKQIKKVILVLLISFASITPARADFWGGDLIYLAQILENALRQLIELRNMVENGKSQLEFIRDINRGINDSLRLADTISPYVDPGIYQDWRSGIDSIRKLQQIYGNVTDNPNAQVQRDSDQNVAEAVTLNNEVYNYTQSIDQLGEVIKEYSHSVSPGGAQKLTAQTLGVMLQVMNQSLRTQATGLKIQAQALAVQNKKEKDSTKEYLATANTLKVAMKNEPVRFKVPRF